LGLVVINDDNGTESFHAETVTAKTRVFNTFSTFPGKRSVSAFHFIDPFPGKIVALNL
jgi:hypothetical protein